MPILGSPAHGFWALPPTDSGLSRSRRYGIRVSLGLSRYGVRVSLGPGPCRKPTDTLSRSRCKVVAGAPGRPGPHAVLTPAVGEGGCRRPRRRGPRAPRGYDPAPRPPAGGLIYPRRPGRIPPLRRPGRREVHRMAGGRPGWAEVRAGLNRPTCGRKRNEEKKNPGRDALAADAGRVAGMADGAN